jgi:RHS repeat-associated protein
MCAKDMLVHATIREKKLNIIKTIGDFDHTEAEEVESMDYYAFGSKMRGVRNTNSLPYIQRYGFNGKDQFFKTGDQTNYDYGFRVYNAGLGRFLSVDPLAKKVLLGSHCCRYFT